MTVASPKLSSSAVARSMAILIALRVVYAYNWFDVSAGLPQEALPSQQGILVAVFFAGASAFQVPAGLLARRYGTRALTLLGGLVLGVAGLASAFAPDIYALLACRLAAGAGAGLFFSPAIALVASLYPEGRRGAWVGAFSSAFAAGAGLGTFVPSILDPVATWRASLALGGLLMLGLTALAIVGVPSTAGRAPEPSQDAAKERIPAPLRSPGVWAIGLAFVGLEGASLSAATYFVDYAHQELGWTLALAGSVAALFVAPSLFGGPVGGRLTERFTNRRTQMFVFTGLPALAFLLLPQAGLVGSALIATQFSFCFGMVYAMMYVIPPYLPGVGPHDTSLAIGLLNGIQLAGGSAIAYLIGWVVLTRGYDVAWDALALCVVAPLVLLLAIPVTGTKTSAASVAPANPATTVTER